MYNEQKNEEAVKELLITQARAFQMLSSITEERDSLRSHVKSINNVMTEIGKLLAIEDLTTDKIFVKLNELLQKAKNYDALAEMKKVKDKAIAATTTGEV